MAILDDVKQALRISAAQKAFDGEIQGLIDAARADLQLSGLTSALANDDTDPLIVRAITVYAKAHFGFNNPDHERLLQAYEMLKNHLTLSAGYIQFAVMFVVTDGTNALPNATVTFRDETRSTNSNGEVVFRSYSGQNLQYTASLSGYKTVTGNIDVTADMTVNVALG